MAAVNREGITIQYMVMKDDNAYRGFGLKTTAIVTAQVMLEYENTMRARYPTYDPKRIWVADHLGKEIWPS